MRAALRTSSAVDGWGAELAGERAPLGRGLVGLGEESMAGRAGRHRLIRVQVPLQEKIETGNSKL